MIIYRKVYISGKITGLPREIYYQKFDEAEQELKRLGYSVINPVKVNAQMPDDTTYEQYMAMSKTMLEQADIIYMLDNWTTSPGAQKELAWALKWNKRILYQQEEG